MTTATSQPNSIALALGFAREFLAPIEAELRAMKIVVSPSTTQGDAIKRTVAEMPSVLLVDLTAAGVDGMAIARHLTMADVDTALVYVGAKSELEEVMTFIRAGAADYVLRSAKPTAFAEAVARASTNVQRRRKAREAFAQKLLKDVAKPRFASIEQISNLLRDAVDDFRTGKQPLPTAPPGLHELRKRIVMPNVRVNEVTELMDEQLSAQVLKLANSFEYAGTTKVEDLGVALRRVGFRQAQAWVEAIVSQRRFAAREPKLAALQNRIWRYSLARAVAMRRLAESPGAGAVVASETAYLIGLFADIGAIFMLWLIAERASITPGFLPIEAESTLPLLRELHAQLGEIVLQMEQTPEPLPQLSRLHHSNEAPSGASTEWGILVLGMSIADRLVADVDRDPTRLLGHDPNVLAKLRASFGLMPAAMDKLSAEARAEFDAVVSVVT